jgi:hypothetical protein
MSWRYYFNKITESDMNFKFYWFKETYFYQQSVLDSNTSTIQNDTF